MTDTMKRRVRGFHVGVVSLPLFMAGIPSSFTDHIAKGNPNTTRDILDPIDGTATGCMREGARTA